MQNLIPRPEYPRPQMIRDSWLNLNGEWDFKFDFGKSGKEQGWYKEGVGVFDKTIIVPFCPESILSGIHYVDFIPAVWYRKHITLSQGQCDNLTLLHFGAVDYECEVWVNGISVGCHKGGYSSFQINISSALHCGDNEITVYAQDDTRCEMQPRGKQSIKYNSFECLYTRTTGIWQTVWLEFVPKTYIESYRVIGDPLNKTANLLVKISGNPTGFKIKAEAFFKGEQVGEETLSASPVINMTLQIKDVRLWDIGQPNLYDLTLTLSHEENLADTVTGYFGLRTIEWRDKTFYINQHPVFQRLVLDQGYYPDGIYTAPNDEALIHDIELSLECGFNGARLHERVFEERFLYHADKLGYIVWGEMGNWGLDAAKTGGLEIFLPEWTEIVARDFNHPAIIGWCPFNETIYPPRSRKQDNELLRNVYRVTKMLDPTRPVIDTSGYVHVETDIYDIHDYEQDPNVLRDLLAPMTNGGNAHDPRGEEQKYAGQPYMVSEYGGTWWSVEESEKISWGYGEQATAEKEVIDRYVGLTTVLLENPAVCGFCYTQLYDVEQEQNGLYTYERKRKFSNEAYERIVRCNRQIAAIEKK